METLNKKALVNTLAEQAGITKKDATKYVEILFDTIANALVDENKVDISGFGKFEVKTRNARTGINPVTKETIQIPETKVPSFKASKTLKELVK